MGLFGFLGFGKNKITSLNECASRIDRYYDILLNKQIQLSRFLRENNPSPDSEYSESKSGKKGIIKEFKIPLLPLEEILEFVETYDSGYESINAKLENFIVDVNSLIEKVKELDSSIFFNNDSKPNSRVSSLYAEILEKMLAFKNSFKNLMRRSRNLKVA